MQSMHWSEPEHQQQWRQILFPSNNRRRWSTPSRHRRRRRGYSSTCLRRGSRARSIMMMMITTIIMVVAMAMMTFDNAMVMLNTPVLASTATVRLTKPGPIMPLLAAALPSRPIYSLPNWTTQRGITHLGACPRSFPTQLEPSTPQSPVTSVYSPSSRAQTSSPISLSTDRRRTDQQGWQIYLVTDDSTQDCCYARPDVSESTTIAIRQLLNYSLRNNLVHHLQPNKTMSSMMWSVGDSNPGHSVSQPCAAPTELQGDNKEMMLVKSTNIKTKYDEHQWYFTDHHGQYDKHQRQYKMRTFGHRSFSNSKTRTMSSNRNQRRRWGEELSLPMMYFTACYCWDVVRGCYDVIYFMSEGWNGLVRCNWMYWIPLLRIVCRKMQWAEILISRGCKLKYKIR